MISIFAQANLSVTRSQVSSWLKKDDDVYQQPCNDLTLAHFLDGMIADRRGKKKDNQLPTESILNNNVVFRKLKIALGLEADDILRIMSLVDFSLSKHELSAFFRRKEHKHYRECQEQILRNFLHGLQIEYRKE